MDCVQIPSDTVMYDIHLLHKIKLLFSKMEGEKAQKLKCKQIGMFNIYFTMNQ